MTGPAHQVDLVPQLLCLIADHLIETRVVKPGDQLPLLDLAAVGGGKDMGGLGAHIEHAFEALSHPDRPGHRRTLDFEHRLHFVQNLDGVPPLPVQLVDEGQNRGVPQTTNLHQFDGARFHTLGHIDHHQRGIHRREGAVSVLGEILVARGVEQIDDGIAVGKLHDRRGDRDTPFLLQFHPVGGGVTRGLAPLHRAGHLDGAAVEQQLLREGRFPASGWEMMAKVRRRWSWAWSSDISNA